MSDSSAGPTRGREREPERGPWRTVATTARRVVDEVRAAEVSFLAASLAYYAFSSLLPLLVLAVVAATVVGGDPLRERVLLLAGEYLVPAAQGLVGEALANRAGGGGVGLVGLAIVTWGALKVFRGLDVAFAKVYGTDGGSIVEQVRDGVVALAGIGVGVIAVTVAGAAIALAPLPFAGLLAPVVLLVTLVAAFLPIYYVFPDADVTVREAAPGALVAAVGWTLLAAGFGVYADYATSEGSAALYGVLGAVLLLVSYLYLAALVLLVGAVVNAVLAGRTPDRSASADRSREPGDDADADADSDAGPEAGSAPGRGRDRDRDAPAADGVVDASRDG